MSLLDVLCCGRTPCQLAKDGFDQDTTVKVIMATTRDRSDTTKGPFVGWISPDNYSPMRFHYICSFLTMRSHI